MRNGDLEASVDLLITALCLDYFRREEAIENHGVSHRTEIEFRYFNFKIYDGCAEIVGEEYCEDFIREIGMKVGFAKSALADCMGEQKYKNLKRSEKKKIAEALHLIDT